MAISWLFVKVLVSICVKRRFGFFERLKLAGLGCQSSVLFAVGWVLFSATIRAPTTTSRAPVRFVGVSGSGVMLTPGIRLSSDIKNKVKTGRVASMALAFEASR